MKTVGERYAYFYARVAELELLLKIAKESMCEESFERYKESIKFLPENK